MGGEVDFPQLRPRYSEMDVKRMLAEQREALRVVHVVRLIGGGDHTEVLCIKSVQQTPRGLWVEVE